ncbi:hypothetical protein [Nitratireductor basaltis]|uniref:Uncharacterized protein n=1 Tax=Nitratireductor basaltis TaxID=472175 RepID=A0A084U7B7_9HYPH|nr:hypothetical protein [Nitratireductor basaltis]KFB08853.1 hypothetical protein EL18_03107 [Nitratireductor basaltis]
MSAPLEVSAALLNSRLVKASVSDPELVEAYMSGAIRTKGPSRPPNPLNRHSRRLTARFNRKWQRSPDRAASVKRRRMLGGSSSLPDTIRHHYTEGERAALAVVAGEVKHHGVCDLPLDRIAAVAGVSRTTVQNALREARARGHVIVEPRPRKGQKNLTNLVHVSSKEWLAWLKRGPSLARSIGFKTFHPTKNQDQKTIAGTCQGAENGHDHASGDGAKGLRNRERRRSRAQPAMAKEVHRG